MSTTRFTRVNVAVVAMVVASTSALAACAPGSSAGGGSGNNSTDPIVIGASLPLSGALAGFGSFQKWGYEHAVKQVNDAGGLSVGGVKRKVNLKIVDDKTDPNQVSSNIKTLISSDKAVGLLGSCTPDLVNPGAVVADSQGLPFVAGCDPLEVFTGVKKWTWAWDIFFSVPELSASSLKAMDELGFQTNKKVAILHDNGPDGKIVGTTIWPQMARQSGYQIVANVEFPVDNADFTAAVQKARTSGADILLVDCVTPQAISLRKQMAAVGWTPKVMVNEKGAEPVQYAQALGSLADGVIVGAYWDPSFPYPGAKELQQAFESETGRTSSQHIADSYAAAQVLLDAISTAGSTDPQKINDAIAKTDKDYAVGRVTFAADHTAKIPVVVSQWQSGKPVIISPKDRATGTALFPMPAK
ncbi:MAG: branched-chain amino acid transport system substrate-binding protein [Micromonosporaceae bacterium]